MATFIVRQPNGKYAAFSTIVDDFTGLDYASYEEAADNHPGCAPREYTLFGLKRTADDPDGEAWNECMRDRASRWDEPGWTEQTRLLCDIIDEAVQSAERKAGQ
jgi:hypothetical protein